MEASAKWDSAAACSGEGLAGGRPPGLQTSGEPEYAVQVSTAALIRGCPVISQMWPFAWPVSQSCSASDGWYVHGLVEFAAACFHGVVPGSITQRRSSASVSAPRKNGQHVCSQAMPQGTSQLADSTVGQKRAQLGGHGWHLPSWHECECIPVAPAIPLGGTRAIPIRASPLGARARSDRQTDRRTPGLFASHSGASASMARHGHPLLGGPPP